jgi:CRISPR/Cas system-associated exonuclease Cas4 (RecB family)
MHDPYVNASEVNSFVFCKRAWHLEQRGAASSLEAEREAGIAVHRQYGQLVQASRRNERLAVWLAIAALLLLFTAVLLLRWQAFCSFPSRAAILAALYFGHRGRVGKLPGEVVYDDTVEHVEVALVSHRYRLKGRPDHIIRTRDGFVPVEKKSKDWRGQEPLPGDRAQVLAYCL